MSGISYTTAGGGGLMTTFSGSFTNAQILAGANSPLFPGIVTQIYFNITANPTWPANTPRIFFTLDTAVAFSIEVLLPPLAADPFNLNFTPIDLTGLQQPYYTQSFASSFLSVTPVGGGLVGTTINFTALCWQP
jgi:hypothetical protein